MKARGRKKDHRKGIASDHHTQARYDAARTFALSFSGAGVGVLVALFAYQVAGFFVEWQAETLALWEWCWAPPIFALSLICFFRLYWLHWNTLSYLWPFDSFRLYTNDVGAYIAGCFWLLLMREPWFWPIAATGLLFLCYLRVHMVRCRGPLAPLTRDSLEWKAYVERYDRFRKDHWLTVACYGAFALVNMLLWILLVRLGRGEWAYFRCVVPAASIVFSLLGAYANWPTRVSCPFFPMKRQEGNVIASQSNCPPNWQR